MGTQKQYTQDFKEDAVNYRYSHPELSLQACAENLGISHSSLKRWCDARNEKGKVIMRGSGNYSSDEAKEIARLKKELKNTQDMIIAGEQGTENVDPYMHRLWRNFVRKKNMYRLIFAKE